RAEQQTVIAPRCAGGKLGPLHQHDLRSSPGELMRGRAADDPPTDDHHIRAIGQRARHGQMPARAATVFSTASPISGSEITKGGPSMRMSPSVPSTHPVEG